MNTDIARGPKVCPSCGKENPPTAARCAFCLTPLDGAIQATPPPEREEVRLPEFPGAQRIGRPPLTGFAAVAAAIGVAFLILASGFITFVAVCTATNVFAPAAGSITNGCLGVVLASLAALLVIALITWFFYRAGWR